MSPEMQFWVVLGVVVLSTYYVLLRSWRVWRPRPEARCGGGCGCAQPAAPASDRVVLTVKQR
ncbi:MAG TPA: hypothetical protein PKC45_10180 [Gemmatales bacterium]|nr:hypothetical protein [Gemmatales bacterium]